MNRKIIYVDLDDVLCQTARHFLAIVEREFGKKIAYDQLTDFDVGIACGLRPAEREELYRIVHEPEELLEMAPVAEGISTLKRWADQGFEIAIVTGRPPDSYEPSMAWLARHGVTYHSFTMVDKYGRFATEHTIAIRLEDLGQRNFAWAVEDSLAMGRYLAVEMKVPVALIDRPWNRGAAEYRRLGRYRDWPAIAEAAPALIGAGKSSSGK